MTNKHFSETRGIFYVVGEDNRAFHWSFPGDASLEENYDKLSYIRDQIWKTMEEKRLLEKENEDKSKNISDKNKEK